METPVNINKDKVEHATLILLYKNILLVWERVFKLQKLGYSIRSRSFKIFKSNNGLTIYPAKNNKEIETIVTENSLKESLDNYFVFTPNNSQVYELMRHLRNSVAHGNYNKKKMGRLNYIQFEDRYRKDITMIGQLKLKDLEELILAIYKSKD